MSNPERALSRQETRTNPWAVVVFVLALMAGLGFIFVVPAFLVALASNAVRNQLVKQPEAGGQGLASAAYYISCFSALAGIGAFLATIRLNSGGDEIRRRSLCAANLRGLSQSMAIYAEDNSDRYPAVVYAPWGPSMNAVQGTSSGLTQYDEALKVAISPASPQAGSVQGCLWLLVLNGQVAPKQFVCRSDPWKGESPAAVTTSSGEFYNNFQSPKQLSYSMAYPWNARGECGGWWTGRADAGLPLIADMAPRQGTGTPARVLNPVAAPADPRTWNSGNHEGDGQNVAYGDGHSDFARRPTVGQREDNIYTMSGAPSRGPAQFGGIPAGDAAPALTAEEEPFDIFMLPVRDESTGKM